MDFHNLKPVFLRIFLAWSRNHNVLYTAKGCFAMLQHSLDSCALVTGTAGLTIPSVFTPHARASERFWEFFTVNIRNRNTRQAYYHDDVQKIQLVFIANCRDETATRQGVQRVFDWLEQTGGGALLSSRAASRAKIVRAIAKEAK